MILFKVLFLISDISIEVANEANGWVTVERANKEEAPLGADETDPSIWVIFAKELENEKFLVGFPVEPTYKYLDSGMELLASSGGSEHRLQVIAPTDDLLSARKKSLGIVPLFEKTDETGAEIAYWKEGVWFMERLVSTEKHSYILQTKNSDFDSQSHRIFAASLDIEHR